MKKRLLLLATLGLAAGAALAGTTVDQGQPGSPSSPWNVKISGSSPPVVIVTDGGFLGSVLPQPCSALVQTNDAGIGTTASRIPVSGSAANRIWIRVCNSILNSSSAQCICSSYDCPVSVAVGALGDVLATGDCATYPVGVLDGGIPCCVCNGAGTFLPSTECVP